MDQQYKRYVTSYNGNECERIRHYLPDALTFVFEFWTDFGKKKLVSKAVSKVICMREVLFPREWIIILNVKQDKSNGEKTSSLPVRVWLVTMIISR